MQAIPRHLPRACRQLSQTIAQTSWQKRYDGGDRFRWFCAVRPSVPNSGFLTLRNSMVRELLRCMGTRSGVWTSAANDPFLPLCAHSPIFPRGGSSGFSTSELGQHQFRLGHPQAAIAFGLQSTSSLRPTAPHRHHCAMVSVRTISDARHHTNQFGRLPPLFADDGGKTQFLTLSTFTPKERRRLWVSRCGVWISTASFSFLQFTHLCSTLQISVHGMNQLFARSSTAP